MIDQRTCTRTPILVAAGLLLVSLLGNSGSAQAGLILSADQVTMAPGGSAMFNVTLQATGPDLSFNVAMFQFELTIDNAASPASLLEFSPGLDAAMVSGNPNYIFSGIATNSPLLDIDPSRLTAGFSDFSGDPVFSKPASSELILGTFTVSGVSGADPVAGDTFTITFDNVAFFDDSFNSPTGDITTVDGSVTVTTADVPEPASLAIFALLGGGAAWHHRRRRLAGC